MSTSQLCNNRIYIDQSIGYLDINLVLNDENNKFTQTILMYSDETHGDYVTHCLCEVDCDCDVNYDGDNHSDNYGDNMAPIIYNEYNIDAIVKKNNTIIETTDNTNSIFDNESFLNVSDCGQININEQFRDISNTSAESEYKYSSTIGDSRRNSCTIDDNDILDFAFDVDCEILNLTEIGLIHVIDNVKY